MLDPKPHLQDPDPKVRALAEEVCRLRQAIEAHRDKSGHELCWLNDLELWRAVAPADYDPGALPVREEFLAQCGRYYESRLKGTPYEEPKTKKRVDGE
jgi:hypothetical protein